MDVEREIMEIDTDANEQIRAKLDAYVRLRGRLALLTGVDEPNEEFLFDILEIKDVEARREAARVAKRMRRLVRETFSRL